MKKLLSIFMIACVLFSLPVFSIFALQDIDSFGGYDITTSDVLTDLNRTYIDGKQFDAAQYPLNPEADYMLLLNIIEYAWADYDYDDDTSAYGLYFYMYNPSGDKPLTRGGNMVQMSVSKNDFYVEYFLNLVSSSDDYRFLKFKIVDPTAVLNRLWTTTRTYKISGIEIETKAAGVKEYNISGTYTFTGLQSKRTLECKTDTLLTLSVHLGDTCYRTDTSDQGAFHKYELDSVYFSIPDKILEIYGDEIERIRFQMTQKRITGIVTSNQAAYNGALDYISKGIAPNSMSDYSKSHSSKIGWFFQTNVLESWNDFLRAYSWNAPGYTNRQYLSFIGYAPGITSENMSPISGDVLLEYWDKYPLKDESLSHYIPLDTYEIDINDSFTSLSYESNHGFLDRMLEYGFGTKKIDDQTVFSDVEPFRKIEYSDVFGKTAADIASSYYVLEEDVDIIKTYISSAEACGETVYLFRFNMQDYLAIPGFMDTEIPNILADPTSDSFYFEEYIYENFDIMDISLHDENNIVTTLPVVMSPVTIVPDVEEPFEPETIFDDLLEGGKNLKKIIAIVLGVVALAVIVLIIVKAINSAGSNKNSNGSRRRRKR